MMTMGIFSWLPIAVQLWFVFVFALALIIASAIHSDARRLQTMGSGTFLFGAGGWWCLSFVGCMAGWGLGIPLTVGIYWLIHHSALRRDKPPGSDQAP